VGTNPVAVMFNTVAHFGCRPGKGEATYKVKEHWVNASKEKCAALSTRFYKRNALIRLREAESVAGKFKLPEEKKEIRRFHRY